MKKLLFILVLFLTIPSFARVRTSSFITIENPTSESGLWVNGKTTGLDWSDCNTKSSGSVVGTQTSEGFTDATCLMNGPWGPDQTATATVVITNNDAVDETEVRLRSKISSHSNSGYEANVTGGYSEVVRWNGALGDFTSLIHCPGASGVGTSKSCGPGSPSVTNGNNTLSANIVGSIITVSVNGSVVATVTDPSPIANGAPGIGFNTFNTSGGNNNNHSISAFTASDTFGNRLSSENIADTRTVDWSSNAGIDKTGVLPSASWTQCGSTINGYTGSCTTINTAISSCAANHYVHLSGTFSLTCGISISGKSSISVRGDGANLTDITFTGAGAGNYNSVVSMEPSSLNESNGSEQNVCDWTSGYAQGTNVLTVANCGSTTPAKGSLSNLNVGDIIMASQLDEPNDTGTLWNCLNGVSEGGTQCANNPTGSAGEARHNGTTITGSSYRSQEQGFIVTAINGSNITVDPPIKLPNWSSAQKPQIWFATSPITKVGIENLSITATNSGAGQSILIGNCNQCFVSGVRSVMANRSHIRILFSTHYQIQNNYMYGNISHATVSYGIEMFGGWDGLIVNNIFQQSTDSEPSCSGACEGNVIAYNYDINNVYVTQGWEQAGNYLHASGTAYNLWEGNVGDGYNADDVHGTHAFDTIFRNYLIGFQYAGCGDATTTFTCIHQTTPVILQAGARYFNVVGNVLGKSGFHTNYTCNATSTASCNGDSSIFVTGYSGNGGQQASAVNGFCGQPGCTSHGAFDPQVGAYLMRWGNYDTVNAANRFSASEVPSTTATFPSFVPVDQTLPASYFYPTKPTWWPAPVAWPPIGPDVTGGTATGSNGGTTWVTQSVGGHVNDIPAQICFHNVMGGPADGTGNVLTFNADNCYAPTGQPITYPTVPTATGMMTKLERKIQ
jgi:hypothetical protein